MKIKIKISCQSSGEMQSFGVPEKKHIENMKIAELNIGLASKTLGEISPETAIAKLNAYGFRVITQRTQESISKDGKENCFAVKVECPKDWQDCLERIARNLGQDCIAVVGFIGPAPYDTFAPEFWVSPELSKEEEIRAHLDALEQPKPVLGGGQSVLGNDKIASDEERKNINKPCIASKY